MFKVKLNALTPSFAARKNERNVKDFREQHQGRKKNFVNITFAKKSWAKWRSKWKIQFCFPPSSWKLPLTQKPVHSSAHIIQNSTKHQFSSNFLNLDTLIVFCKCYKCYFSFFYDLISLYLFIPFYTNIPTYCHHSCARAGRQIKHCSPHFWYIIIVMWYLAVSYLINLCDSYELVKLSRNFIN